MDRVIIGVDPHKASVTIEARDSREILRATGRFGTDTPSYRQLLQVARQWPERIWAVEGANGIGRPLTQQLLASGEQVLDVPARRPRPRLRCRSSSGSPTRSMPRP
jgi:transposase